MTKAVSLRSKCAKRKLRQSRDLRLNMTPAERAMWDRLRGKSLGVRTHRQSIIRGYIVDFYVPKWGLVIEIDGSAHNGRAAYDAKRDDVMQRIGLNVIRFKNEEVWSDAESVMQRIKAMKR